jgi:Fe-S-cluster containining protein
LIVDRPQAYAELHRELDESVRARIRETEETTGMNSPCRGGCGACCRQAVSIELGEAVVLLIAVRALPKAQRELVWKGLGRWFRQIDRHRIDPRFDPAHPENAVAYFDASIACPLLVDERCAVYSARPLPCRVHSVVGEREGCKGRARPGRWSVVPAHDLLAPFRQAVIKIEGCRLPVILPIGGWLALGWRLMSEAEADVEAWAEEIIAGGSTSACSVMHGDADPGDRGP